MQLLSELLGPLKAMAVIRPPERSYASWVRFLDDCQDAGVAALYVDAGGARAREFATPLGYALLRRWRWLREAQARGLSYAEAEAAFGVGMERDETALRKAEDDQKAALARAIDERDDADALLRHARERGL